jgi:hypothetical protein
MRKVLKSLTFVAAALMAQAAFAQTTYNYIGNAFTFFSCGPTAPPPPIFTMD